MQAKAKRKGKTTEQVLKEQAAQARANRGNTAMVKAASTGQQALTVADNSNAWLEINAELDKYIGAPLLKFTKQGEFSISDAENIPDGTRCIAHADEITLGWVKWVDGKPDPGRRVGRIADRFIPPQREELGDTDPKHWEMQDDGTRRDPWQFQMTVPVSRLDTSDTYQFTTGSKGGLSCLSALTRAYGRRVQEGKSGLPIVELKADHYKHRQYGKIYKPLMIIVGWTDDSGKKPLSRADDLNDSIGF